MRNIFSKFALVAGITLMMVMSAVLVVAARLRLVAAFPRLAAEAEAVRP